MSKREIIEITLNDKESYKNPFNEDKLSSELSEYILQECKGMSYSKDIEIKIKAKFTMDRVEKIKLINMIRSSYSNDINENTMRFNNLIKRNILLFFCGLIFIILSVVTQKESPVVAEIILIVGWVVVWEVVYFVFFSDYPKRMYIKRLRQLIDSKITFCK